MLPLLRGTTQCDQRKFDHWVMASVTICWNNETDLVMTTTEESYKKYVRMTAVGTNGLGQVRQRLQCLLWPREEGASHGDTVHYDEPTGVLQWKMSFSPADIAHYIKAVGDTNPIHTGESPMVPGLCILWKLQRQLALETLHWRVSFHVPVYAGDWLRVYETDHTLRGYVGAIPVFTIRKLRI